MGGRPRPWAPRRPRPAPAPQASRAPGVPRGLGTGGRAGGGLHPAPAPGSPAGRKAGRRGPGRRGLGAQSVRQPPVPEHRATDGPGIPVTVGFIYSPASATLRTAWPGRGGRPGGRGVEGRREVRCSRGPESFLVGPNWGLPSLRGAPVLAPGTPRGRAGEHSAGSKLFASSCPFKVLRPCTPRPRPTPLPAIPLGAANSSPFPHELEGPGRSLLFRFGKVFKGFFLALLVSDWASGG